MKPSKQDKSSIISGVVILTMAAVFTISLLIQAFDFGTYGADNTNILYILGKMLFSVYGFSSLLIPTFFLIAGLSCFASNWTARKAFRLLTAIVPFFTCVISENLCRSVLLDSYSKFPAVKITVVLVTGLMLVIIELVGAGIIADKITGKSKPKTKQIKAAPQKPQKKEKAEKKIKLIKFPKKFTKPKKEKPVEEDEDDFIDDEDDEILDDEYENDFDEADTEIDSTEEVDDEEIVPEEKKEVKIHPAFEEAFEAYDLPNFPKAAAAPETTEIKDEKIPEPVTEEKAEEEEIIEVQKVEEPVEEEPMQPLLSKEEYDALMTDDLLSPEPAQENAEDNLDEELEWNNLPPEQNELPPDYDPDFFEDESLPEPVITEEDNEEVEEIYEEEVPTIEYDEPTPEVDDFGMPTSELDDTPYESDEEPEEDFMNDSIFNIAFDDEVDSEEDKKKTYEQFLIESVRATTPEQPETPEPPATVETPMTADVTPERTDEPKNQEEADSSSSGMFSIATDIFDDMEDDIRKENGLPDEPANLDPHLNSATNLTPDGMEKFFNAQNKANAPVTEEIQGNLPSKKSHRATKKGPYVIPSDLLTEYDADQYWIIDEETKAASLDLKNTLAEFKIEAEIIGIKKGPVVTMFEILPAPGVRLSKIVGLQDNIALRLAASSIRIVAPIPGKRAVGIEVPNKHRSIVSFRELIEQKLDEFKKMAIPVVLGKDILGKAQLLDLVKTPHLLIAGATGAGKSVCVNSIILSILYKRAPDKVKLILVDPKVVELKLYNDIPHLLTPVITEPKKAFQALQYCLCEMERRYSMLDNMGVRDISSYNARIKERHLAQETLPYIVVIIDEFADLMATTGKELEQTVSRLTAMSRAVGIHLVLATQRPSVNVITGLIKANIPSRIAFMVASRMDSSIIIDSVGAEKLLGRGDMLYASAVDPNPVRIQGTFVSDEEVEAVVDYVKQYGEPEYIDEEIFVEDEDEQGELFGSDEDFGDDPLYDQALEIVVREGKASASFIQRKLKIGYNRAARLVEEMEERGIVGPANGSKPREVIHVP